MSSVPAVPTSCLLTIPSWRSASRALRADRRTCCSTIESPSTCLAATWLSGGKRFSPSTGSTRSICAPVTTSTFAGGCRRRSSGLASHRRRSSGTIIGRRSRRTGASRSGTVRARRGSRPTTPRSSYTAPCCGTDGSTAPCRSSARCRSAASTAASGERRHFRPSTRRACIQRNCCRIRLHGKCSRRSLSLRAQRRSPAATSG